LLFVVATPIGNLEDISERALRTLRSCDIILCEDTRRSSILLNRYEIKAKLISYHKFKEQQALERILTDLESGLQIALVSDAGTPCINDPGRILVDACLKKGLKVSAIPGPCSIIQAVVLSGFELNRFQFLGFLDKKPETELRQAMSYPGVSVAFISPERLTKTLALIDEKRQVAVLREMTKTFEECRRGTSSDLLEHYQKHPPKGEVVLVIDQGPVPDDLSLDELVKMLQELHGLTLREAIKESARMKHIPKREVYNKFHK
jgi:16S rRNA (cytidine1402-2'-O)-methyltransferase